MLPIPGARPYAPFELQYSYVLPDWVQRRLATDVFHIGCLIVYVFTNIVLPGHVFSRLDPIYQPDVWGDPYLQLVPHISAAFESSLSEIAQDFPVEYRDELVSLVRDLCNPNPSARGVGQGPSTAAGTSLWLQRFVSQFAILERRASVKARAKIV